MSGERKDLEFKINAFTPATIPMERLAEYMKDLARLLGESEYVHFVDLGEGSVKLNVAVEYESIPKVQSRVRAAESGIGPGDAVAAFRSIDKRLAADNADGFLCEKGGAQILEFPGRRAAKIPEFGYVTQNTVLDGRVRRLGGRAEDTAPVMLETHDGFETHCVATRETTRALAKYFDGPLLRFTGQGKWLRTENGWRLERFGISSFEPIDARGVAEVVADMQALPNPHWKTLKDPIAELREIRGDDND